MRSTMLSIERHEIIVNIVKQREKISILELSKILNVSLNTTRSDVEVLKKKGVVIRVHGGIALPISNYNASTNDIGIRYLKNISEKRTIAKNVARELAEKNHCTLFMDSATSTMLVLEELLQISNSYTIITHFTNIAQMVSGHKDIVVVLCGGVWWGNENCTIGQAAVQSIAQYQVDIALIGCTALDLEHGVTNALMETIPVKQEMIKNAEKTWLLCDSSKFDKKSLVKIAELSQIDTIFTDKAPSQAWLSHSMDNFPRIVFP